MADQDVHMESVGNALALRAPGGGTQGNPQSKETPISQNTGLSYGLPETHVCPMYYVLGVVASLTSFLFLRPLSYLIQDLYPFEICNIRDHYN